MNLLRFRYEPDDDWCGKLIVMCEANGFAGEGEAWFSPDDLRGFAKATQAYPLPKESPPSLRGGLGDEEGNIEHVHVGIRFEPHDMRGMIRATVQLATQVYYKEEELAGAAVIRFLLTYGDLAPFGSAFADLIDGKTEEVILGSTA